MRKQNLFGNILGLIFLAVGFFWRNSWILAIMVFGYLAIYNHNENKKETEEN